LRQKAFAVTEMDAYPFEPAAKKTTKEFFSMFNLNVLRLLPVRHLIRRANRIMIPGMKGLSLYYAAKFFLHAMNIQKLIERTSAVTYNFLMALPPSFLFMFSLVPYLSRHNMEQNILSLIRLMIHNEKTCQGVCSVVTDFMEKQHYDILSFGVIMMLFFSSNGIMGLMRSFDKSQTLYRRRTGMQRRWTAIKLTVMLIGVSMIVFSLFIIQSPMLTTWALKTFHSIVLLKMMSFLFFILIVFVAISTIYTYGPSLKHRFRFASAGSLYATIASIIVTSVFYFLVTNFIHYNRVYGSIGILIAFMVLVWLNTAIILIGYELNVNLLLAKLAREKTTKK